MAKRATREELMPYIKMNRTTYKIKPGEEILGGNQRDINPIRILKPKAQKDSKK